MYMNGCRKLRANGKGKDRDKEDREHDKSSSDLLQEEEWASEEGL